MPCWNGATYRTILRSVLSGRVIDGPDLDRLRSAVMARLDVQEALLCGSGSFALEAALRACGVREGDEVVIPTLCCTSVVPPILAVGATPVLADAGEELNLTAATVEPALTEKTAAIVVAHLFGNPADIDAIVDLARGKHLRVIDDAAQALGATIQGRAAGSFGDAGILSFGSGKVCSGIGGGVAVSRNKELLGGGLRADMPDARLAPAFLSPLSAIVWRRWRRWTYPLTRLLSPVNSAGPDAPPAGYRKEAMANLGAAVAVNLMHTLDENIAARRARARAYAELLAESERVVLVPHRSGSACLAQVVRVLSGRRSQDLSVRVVEALGRAGYEIQGSYVPIHLLRRHAHWMRQPLRHAERVWADLIELPCDPDVGLDQVERIAAVVKRAVGE